MKKTIKSIRVENFVSNNGNAIPNQFKITTQDGTYFQSYDSIIVYEDRDGNITLGNDWDYSKTTGKYRNIFLGEDKKETERKIKEGIYTVDTTL